MREGERREREREEREERERERDENHLLLGACTREMRKASSSYIPHLQHLQQDMNHTHTKKRFICFFVVVPKYFLLTIFFSVPPPPSQKTRHTSGSNFRPGEHALTPAGACFSPHLPAQNNPPQCSTLFFGGGGEIGQAFIFEGGGVEEKDKIGEKSSKIYIPYRYIYLLHYNNCAKTSQPPTVVCKKWKLSRSMRTSRSTFFCTLGADSRARSVLINRNLCVGAQSEVY